MGHRGTPGVQHRDHARSSTKVLGIGGNLDHRVSARPHQQIVDLAFVLMRDVGDRFGQSEDEVEVSHGQQLCLPCGQPCLCRTRLAFGTVTVAARVVGDVLMRAVGAPRDMTAKRRCAAALDCAHHFQLVQADVPCVRRTPGSTMVAEDIRDLQ